MVNTVADNQSIALGDTTAQKKSQVDLLNIQLNNDIYNLGYGSAILKNWGQPGDSVSQAKLRHYGALPGETLQDAKYRYYAAAASLYPPRTNIATDPQGLRMDSLFTTGAPHWLNDRFPADSTYTSITGQVGPLSSLTTCARLTWKTANTGSGRGFTISGNPANAVNLTYQLWPVVVGQTNTISAWFRGTWATGTPTGNFTYGYYDNANNRIGSTATSTATTLTSGVWNRCSLSAVAPVGAVSLGVIFALNVFNTTIGDTLDGTGLLCENNAPKSAVDGVSVAPYFDGSTTNAVWNGTAGASTSTTANGTAGYSSNPTIYPPRTNISTDPQALRNDSVVTGTGPHWISDRVNTSNITYSSIIGQTGPLANLTTAQRMTWKVTTGQSYGWDISGNSDLGSGSNYQLWPVVPGQICTASAWFRGTWAGAAPDSYWRIAFYDSSGVKLAGGIAGPHIVLTSGQWFRNSVTLTAPANAAFCSCYYALTSSVITLTIGDTLDGTGLLCENNAPSNAIGGGIAPYFDGSSQNAYWTGTTQNSSSITPDGTAGYYTNITNLIRDPTCTTSSIYWNSTQGQVLGSVDLTTARPGSLTLNSFKAFMNAGPIAFSICPPVTTTLPLIPCVPGQTFTASCWVKTDAAGQNAKISIRWRDSTNTSQVAIDNFTIVNLTANVWVRLSATFTVNVAVVGSGYIQPGVIISSFPIGNNAWMDDYMITADSIVWDYKDGGYPGWTWAGVANQSQSSGLTIT